MTRCGQPGHMQSVHPDSSSAPAADCADVADSADFADFVGAADSSTASCVRTAPVSSAHPLDEFSCLAWPAQRPAHVRQKICAADFPRRASSCTNPRCRFFPLLASLPLPLPQRVPRPPVFFVKPRTLNSPGSSSAPAADSADSADFVGAADSNTARCG